jgi:LmbE family N-acetylglucosaminyl deacetylase
MKVIAFSPHPDDVEIGIGGTIIKLLKANCRIKIVYMTDGRYGSPFIHPETLIKIRKEEARKARQFLGIKDFIELNVEDGALSTLSKPQRIIVKEQIIETLTAADIVFIPTIADLHPDHKATHDLVYEVIKEENLDNLLILKYFVWFFPDFFKKSLDPAEQIWLIKLSEQEMEEKLKVIQHHDSQLKTRRYDQMAKSINQYLAIIFKALPYGEIVGVFNKFKEKTEKFTSIIKEYKDITVISHGYKGKFLRK